jgi:hypothetical protein
LLIANTPSHNPPFSDYEFYFKLPLPRHRKEKVKKS